MWLEVSQRFNLIQYDPSSLVSPWSVNVRALTDEPRPNEPDVFTVGRILADAMSRYDIAECGEDPWEVADADSEGLLSAWESLLDKDGTFRDRLFEGIADPIAYVYRFALHSDFTDWRLAVMDAFCRQFGNNGLILAQYRTTHYSQTEFETLGFRPLVSRSDQEITFMVRDNACARFSMADYPDDAPYAFSHHQEWLEAQGPWKDLC